MVKTKKLKRLAINHLGILLTRILFCYRQPRYEEPKFRSNHKCYKSILFLLYSDPECKRSL